MNQKKSPRKDRLEVRMAIFQPNRQSEMHFNLLWKVMIHSKPCQRHYYVSIFSIAQSAFMGRHKRSRRMCRGLICKSRRGPGALTEGVYSSSQDHTSKDTAKGKPDALKDSLWS